jgi:hypothetical protein
MRSTRIQPIVPRVRCGGAIAEVWTPPSVTRVIVQGGRFRTGSQPMPLARGVTVLGGHEASGEDAPVPWTGRRCVAGQHRRGFVSAARRARSMGDDPRRKHRQPVVDPFARRTRAQRYRLLPSLRRAAGEALHRRLLGSARRRQVLLPGHPSSVHDGRAVHLRSRRAGRRRVQAPRQDEGGDLRPLLGLSSRGAYAARFPEKVAAYVGSGQIGDWAAGESAFVLTHPHAPHRGIRHPRRHGPGMEAQASPAHPLLATGTPNSSLSPLLPHPYEPHSGSRPLTQARLKHGGPGIPCPPPSRNWESHSSVTLPGRSSTSWVSIPTVCAPWRSVGGLRNSSGEGWDARP